MKRILLAAAAVLGIMASSAVSASPNSCPYEPRLRGHYCPVAPAPVTRAHKAPVTKRQHVAMRPVQKSVQASKKIPVPKRIQPPKPTIVCRLVLQTYPVTVWRNVAGRSTPCRETRTIRVNICH